MSKLAFKTIETSDIHQVWVIEFDVVFKQKRGRNDLFFNLAPFKGWNVAAIFIVLACQNKKIKGLNFVQVYRKFIYHSTLCQIQTLLRPRQGE